MERAWSKLWMWVWCGWSVDDGVEKVRSVWSGSLCGAGVSAGVGMRGCGVSCVCGSGVWDC